MSLVDTSAWVEFLRDTGSPTCARVDGLLGDEIATCHPVRKLVDCLIAAHAIHAQLRLQHADADFDVPARHTGLVVELPPP